MYRLTALVTCVFLCSALADEPALQVKGAWMLAVPPGSEETAIFMTLINPGQEPVRIVSGSIIEAARVTPMLTTKEAGRMGMKDVPYLEVPADGRIELRQGGDHLMVYGLKKLLHPGDQVSLKLKVESGGSMVVTVPVARRAP